MQETWVWSLGQEDPLDKGMATQLQYSCHGQRSLMGYSLWGHKELDTTERLTLTEESGFSREAEPIEWNMNICTHRYDRGWDGWMASLTRWTWVWVNSGSWWWRGRPGVLRFMGSQRVGHDWATELNWTDTQIYIHINTYTRTYT